MTSLILDLETFALDGAARYLEPVEAPANYKDPDKIRAYCDQKRAEQLARCALDPDLCVIVAAGWSRGSGSRVEVAANVDQERDTIWHLWDAIAGADTLIGFNLLGFDLPVLIRRSQYLDIPVRPLILDRYRTPHIDLMQRLTFNGVIKAHSLDFYCQRFGIAVDDAHTGADIDGLVRAGEWEAVAAHCQADIERTARLAVRLGHLSIAASAVADVF